jgi:hypothetical protein
MDILYPVRPGDTNEELRFSLRTIEVNYPHDTVWVVGYQPNWVTGVQFIPGNIQPHTRANLYWNLIAACEHPDTPDDFIVFNDDFFVTKPVTTNPILYRGPLKDHIRILRNPQTNWWPRSLTTTLICLQALGYRNPISYELHTPFRVNKQAMCETLRRFTEITPDNPPQWRTLYGNLQRIGGSPYRDGKAYRAGQVNTPYHSTSDTTWKHFHKHFAETFPTPSRYEKADDG